MFVCAAAAAAAADQSAANTLRSLLSYSDVDHWLSHSTVVHTRGMYHVVVWLGIGVKESVKQDLVCDSRGRVRQDMRTYRNFPPVILHDQSAVG